MKFIDLFLRIDLPPVEQQNLRGELFQQKFELIAGNKMFLWDVGKSFPQNGTRYLLGVNPRWNWYDLYLLDCIKKSLEENLTDEVIEIFDLDYVISLDDLQKIFGNISPKQPPILGIWEDGILSKSLWGWEVKTFLIEKYKFTWSPSEEDYIKSKDAKIAKILNR